MPLPQEMPLPHGKPEKHQGLLHKLTLKLEGLVLDKDGKAASQACQAPDPAHAPDPAQAPDQSLASSFSPISDKDPKSMFPAVTHPANSSSIDPPSFPTETNKYYGNMALDDQQCTVFPHPYSLSFTKQGDLAGMGVCHIRAGQRAFGPGNPAEYYLNPIGIKSFIFLTKEDNSYSLKISNTAAFSADAYVSGPNTLMRLPMVLGMGMVTCVYTKGTPLLKSVVGFRAMVKQGKGYVVELNDGVKWSIFSSVGLSLVNNQIVAEGSGNHTIQVCSGCSPHYDDASMTYPTSITLSTKFISALEATYSFTYNCVGDKEPVVWVLPHHVESLSEPTKKKAAGLQLDLTVYGKMSLYHTRVVECVEKNIPDIGFEMWSPKHGTVSFDKYKAYRDKINNALDQDLKDDVEAATNLDLMYFAGKQFNKYAYVLYVAHYIIQDKQKTQTILGKLKKAFERFTLNKQIHPLAYDTTYGGLVSTAGLLGDPNLDFGNSYYNDHHFHYCYFVAAAAILAKIDAELGGDWLTKNKDYFDFLARDYANLSDKDKYFPVSRSFDWFTGHSVAKGLFASADGKDEESSSEDYHSLYALKLWGLATGNKEMVQRSTLQLAVVRRSCVNYILMKNNNKNQPSQFIANKVLGILFDNKCHHTTYFGANLEYIQGIHMIPFTPVSPYVRDETFVKEEWDQLLANHVGKVNDGWKGILMLNSGLIDPKKAWDFFAVDGFNRGFLDGGMSLSWCLTFIVGLLD